VDAADEVITSSMRRLRLGWEWVAGESLPFHGVFNLGSGTWKENRKERSAKA
jgi:hypothetical protein